ncbi:MAG TPA: serine/threonine-protein kinase [Blastocatellia bacterium]|nr:serine/threonine-protein kinase [Blastocatellia bacterium]
MSLANLVGHVLDGKYSIERQLGKGGMGAVYLATHLGTDRPVAIKVIMPQFTRNEEFVERFRREAKAAGRMRHPNIVDVTDFGFAAVDREQVAYLVMEYLDGCTLADILIEENQLPVAWVVDILEQTCSAADEAHQAGIIHRDLKPENIWLEPNRRGGYTVKVLDFGLAKQGDPMALAGAAANPSLSDESANQPTIAASARDTNIIGQGAPTFLPDQALTQAITPDTAATQTLPLNEEAKTHIAPESDQMMAPPAANATAEAVTMIQSPASGEVRRFTSPTVDEEGGTLIMVELPNNATSLDDNSATQLLPPGDHTSASGELARPVAARTTANGAQPTAEEIAAATGSAGGITRVGAILGTPLYMSPEQTRGEALDPRSDIYSLGVIAYQMLAGSPPFTGEINDVLRGHMEAEPPPLRERRKKVSKRTEQVIMSALAKSPAERPATAMSFANALRASDEGPGKLFRRALALYSEHFPVFFRLSLVAYMPVLLLTCLFVILDLLLKAGWLPRLAGGIIAGVLGIVMFITELVSTAVVTGISIWFVVQLAVAPLRPLKLRHALRALKSRIKRLTTTSFRVIIGTILRMCLFIIPGVLYFINSSLVSPVVVMENLRGRAAVRRSKELVKRARPTVIAIVLINLLLPVLLGLLFTTAFGIQKRHMGEGAKLSVRVGELIPTIIKIFILPLLSMLTALLYLKVRQLGGERFNQMLDQFEAEEAPRTRWQQRMRERLTSSGATRSA